MPGAEGISRPSSLSSPARYAAVGVLAALAGAGVTCSLLGRGPSARALERPVPVSGVARTPARVPAVRATSSAPEPSPGGASTASGPAPGAPEAPAAVEEHQAAGEAGSGIGRPEQKAPQATGPRRVNINTAGQAELELLPGIGPSLARRIIEHRTLHGAFRSVADLDKVRGIGPRTLQRLAPLVTVD
jgi:competence protein ComEA